MISKKLLPLCLALFAISVEAQTALKKFDFGPGRVEPGYRRVAAEDIYDQSMGYGFEPGAAVVCTDHKLKNTLRTDACTADKPFYFSVALPEGNYRVKVTLGSQTEPAVTTVKAELRRLMLENIATKKGRFVEKTFVVNIRNPQIEGGGRVKLKDREKTMEWWAWDEKLTLEFNGTRPTISALSVEKIEKIPTVFLLGDSTVCDQPREPYASWGQMLTRFFGPEAALASHAESGESLRSSLGAKRLDKVLSLMKPGDFLLIQFGHNDEKEKGDGVGAFTTYKAALKKYVAETRLKGGIPILLTPMHRRTFDANGKITNSHGDYPEAVRQAATEENVELIDLTVLSQQLYESLGPEKSGALFKEGDGTHHSNYGAYQLAKCIVEAIRRQKLPLARFLPADLSAFDPRRPDPFENFAVPSSPHVTDVKPLGN